MFLAKFGYLCLVLSSGNILVQSQQHGSLLSRMLSSFPGIFDAPDTNQNDFDPLKITPVNNFDNIDSLEKDMMSHINQMKKMFNVDIPQEIRNIKPEPSLLENMMDIPNLSEMIEKEIKPHIKPAMNDNPKIIHSELNKPANNEKKTHFEKPKGDSMDHIQSHKIPAQSTEKSDEKKSENQPPSTLSSNPVPLTRLKSKISSHSTNMDSDDIQTIPIHRVRIFIPIRRTEQETPLQENNNKEHVRPVGILNNILEDILNVWNSLKVIPSSVYHLNITVSERKNEANNSTINIKIKDHGLLYNIPQNAQINKNHSGILNITWNSEAKNLNNSLLLNVSTDDSGKIIFQNIQLSIVKGARIHHYKINEPVPVKSKKDSTTINLDKEVGLYFPDPNSLGVMIVKNEEISEKIASSSLIIMIAGLGLLFGCLVMLMSYWIHNRNRKYIMDERLHKKPIIS